ncbi:MAG: sugar transferase [Rhodobacteraceae bacterium]|nr:sugar transferase [Paracoccaceae bacterium]
MLDTNTVRDPVKGWHKAHGLPLDYYTGRKGLLYRDFGKRFFDIIIVLIGGIFVLPVLLVIAVLVRGDGGPALYSQVRIGESGRRFRFWKFRSMVEGADQMLEDYLASNPAAAREWAETQKLKHDPRISRMGRFLRKSSLDELPQLWNVLVGDMSLVGPRPMLPEQRPLYPGHHYELMRPGITGFWQVSDRNSVSFATRAQHDGRYWREMSLLTDIRTMFRTVGAVLRCSGY